MKKYLFAILFAIVISLNLTSGAFLVKTLTVNSSSISGHAKIKVLEANTLKPILNATVCVVETRHYEVTDKYGYTKTIDLPITPNANFDISLKRDWGEFTLIVYKPGYSTYISFYNQVYPNTTNVGLVCFLSPIINPGDPPIISNVQSPPQDYITTLVNLYKK